MADVARCGDGLAAGPDAVRAAREAAARAISVVAGTPDLACVFVCAPDPETAEAALLAAADASGARVTVGCTSWGVLGDEQAVEQASAVSVFAAHLPGAAVRPFHLETLRSDGGLTVVGLPTPRDDDAAVLLLVEPARFPVDGFVTRSRQVLRGLPVVGGVAIGPTGPTSARLLADGRVVDRGAVGVVLGSTPTTTWRAVVSQGCRPLGPAMTVTAADGNVLLGLAGRPAVVKLREVLEASTPDEQALATSGLQIGVAADEYVDDPGVGDYLVRPVVGVDDQREGLVVGDLVEVGSTVRFHVRDAATAGVELRATLGDALRPPVGLPAADGALLVTCNGRGRRLFPDSAHDLAVTRALLPGAAVAGFFAGGEIGPVGGRNHLHGHTATLLVVGPAPGPASAGGAP